MKTYPRNQICGSDRWTRFIGAMLAVALMIPAVAISQSPATVDLGTASNFVVLAGSAITGTSSTALIGDVGLSPTGGAAITVLTASQVDGTIYTTNGLGPEGDVMNPDLLTTAKDDLTAAYNDAAGRSATGTDAELGGKILTTGVYSAGTFSLTGDLTLSGSATDVFIFKTAATLITATGSRVLLTGGVVWTNVFWQVTSSATLGEGSVFEGTILALTSITANGGAGTTIHGRLLANNAAVTFTGATDLSLPVTLSEFKVMMNGNAVRLNWITSSEVDHLGFNIERKESGGGWLEIASYQEHENLAGHGNTSAEHQYTYTDSEVLRGKTYSYRLLDVDVFGKVETRDDIVRTITVPESMGPEFYELVGAYPNPFNPLTTIAFNVPETATVQLTIHNILGQIIRHLQNREFQPGYYKISWDATDDRGRLVQGGVYFVRFSSEQFTSKVQKIMLLK